MGVVISPESALGQEMAKWEKPYRYEAFPKMLYRAIERQGRGVVSDPYDEAVATACQKVVQNESEMRLAQGQGWCEGPDLALEAWERQQVAYGDEAANTAYHVARMSEPAQREYREASDQTHEHVVDVQPVKRRGRPPKVKPVSISSDKE